MSHRFLLTTVSIVGLLISSAHAARAERMSSDIESRLNTLEERLNRANRMPVSGNPSSLPSFQVEISKIQEDLRAIRGGIEENRFAIEQVQRDMKLSNEDSEYRLKALEQKASGATLDAMGGGALQPTPRADGAVAVTAPAVQAPITPAPVITAPTVSGTIPPTTPVVKPPVLAPVAAAPVPDTGTTGAMHFTDPHEHYNYAVSLIKNKQYPEARASFKEFVGKYKDDKLSGNAYYWLGETYYVGSDFVTAADTFRQGFEASPNGVKAPDNLYKLAKSLLRLEKKQEACVVLSQIQKRYKTRNPEVVGLAFETQKANNCQ
jgi:tol-pal system protein YbgF